MESELRLTNEVINELQERQRVLSESAQLIAIPSQSTHDLSPTLNFGLALMIVDLEVLLQGPVLWGLDYDVTELLEEDLLPVDA